MPKQRNDVSWCSTSVLHHVMQSEGRFLVLKVKCVIFSCQYYLLSHLYMQSKQIWAGTTWKSDQWQMGVFKKPVWIDTSLLTLCLCFPPSSQQRDTYMITLTGAGGTGQRGGGRGGWCDERGRGGLRPAGGLPRDVTHLTTITSGFSLAKSTTKTNGGQCKRCEESESS